MDISSHKGSKPSLATFWVLRHLVQHISIQNFWSCWFWQIRWYHVSADIYRCSNCVKSASDVEAVLSPTLPSWPDNHLFLVLCWGDQLRTGWGLPIGLDFGSNWHFYWGKSLAFAHNSDQTARYMVIKINRIWTG